MKQFLFFAAAMFSFAQLCAAVPFCVPGTLASYEALGSAGCTIGSNTLSSFQTVSGITGATPIAPTAVSLLPFGGTSAPSFDGIINMVANGNVLESIFTYRISGNSYNSTSITLDNSSETGAGAVTDILNFCAGGTFGPDGVTGCSGSNGSLLTLDGVQNVDSAPLALVNFVSATNDFTIDGTFGSAKGGTFINSFTAVPEPVSFLLLGIGSALILVKSRFNN